MFEKKDIIDAYRKFKHFVYYDNTSLLLRKQLAQFEASENFESKINNLCYALRGYKYEIDNEYWQRLFEKITYFRQVKSFKKTNQKEDKEILTNVDTEYAYEAERFTFFIKAPIEIHIISALWSINVGYTLEKRLKIQPYGNKISFEKVSGKDKPVKGLRFFKPYPYQYQKWRDGAIGAAKSIIDNDQNVLLISLDIKNYYHSVCIDLKTLLNDLDNDVINEPEHQLTDLLFKIQYAYTCIVPLENNIETKNNTCILPIGLMSSAILANWYLKDFDEIVNEKLKPTFYGRYVDDIFIVLARISNKDVISTQSVLNKFFIKKKIFSIDPNDEKSFRILPDIYEKMEIQSSKLSVMHFDHSEPTALLDKFVKETRKISSEFRFLPEEDLIQGDFDEAAYNIGYEGSKNKLRSIKEFSEDKFGISKFLAKKIFLTLQPERYIDSKTTKDIESFFKNRRCLELNMVWEKVLTYFVINNAEDSLIKFFKAVNNAINDVVADTKQIEREIKRTYLNQLVAALGLATALKPSIFSNSFKIKLNNIFLAHWDKALPNIEKHITWYRKANLIRHTYVIQPLLNYCVSSSNEKPIDLVVHNKYFRNKEHQQIRIDKKMYEFSPRFVHFHEVTLFHIIQRINNSGTKNLDIDLTKKGQYDQDYLDDAFVDYYLLNFAREEKLSVSDNEAFKNMKDSLFQVKPTYPNHTKNLIHRVIKIDDDQHKSDLNIALGNINISEEVLSEAYLKNPIIEEERKKRINKIFNMAEEEDVDLLVLPEASIPVGWLNWLAEHAKKKQRAMVFGLEHWIMKPFAYNFIVTLLPVKLQNFETLIVLIRAKNHYSPKEEGTLTKLGYEVPKSKKSSYDYIQWRNNYFTVFNCFELANIEHRASFRSKIDFMVACEFNKDVPYFSNIVESSSRDIHCYFVQSNNAQYGDNRITQPKSSVEKDILKIKGGDNPTILTGKININELRSFQIKSFEKQNEAKTFKPTPPDFKKVAVKRRMIGYKGKS